MGGDIPAHSTNTGRDIPVHNTNLGEVNDSKGKRATMVGAHLDKEGGGIAVGGGDVLIRVGWVGGGSDDEGEDDKSGDEGLHLEAALGQGRR